MTRGEEVDGSSGSDDEAAGDGTSKDDFTLPDFESFFAEIRDEWDITEAEAREMYDSFDGPPDEKGGSDGPVVAMEKSKTFDAAASKPVLELERNMEAPEAIQGGADLQLGQNVEAQLEVRDPESNPKLVAIQEALPGLPASRARKVLRTFEKSLNYPSMLELVPILRENMPDHLTSGWLKRRNIRNAEVVLQQAQEEDVVDVPIMNGALQVKTSAGSLDEALAYHEEEFEKNDLVSVM